MEFIRVLDSNDKRLEDMEALYEISFPYYEKRPSNIQRETLSENDFYFEGIYDGDIFVGIVAYWKWYNCVYIEYFAIRQDLRGQNYGSRALSEFCNVHNKIILEIEPPVDDMTKKRLRFYEKLGFKYCPEFEHYNICYVKNSPEFRLDIMSYPEGITQNEYDSFFEFFKRRPSKFVES